MRRKKVTKRVEKIAGVIQLKDVEMLELGFLPLINVNDSSDNRNGILKYSPRRNFERHSLEYA